MNAKAAEPEYEKMSALENLMQKGDVMGAREMMRDLSPQTIDWFEKNVSPKFNRTGSLYEVNLHVPQERLLDWDAPLSAQPHVLDALKSKGALKPDGSLSFMYNEIPRRGGEMYERLTSPLANRLTGGEGASTASNWLRDIGVPGLKFLDGSSRHAGTGTRNFVTFDDTPIEVVRRYARGGLIDDMGSANLWKADGGMVEHHDAERLAAMHAALDREAALRGAHRYADGGSVEASEPEGIPVPPDLVPMIHEQLGLRFADGGAVDWSRYGEVPQTATPAASAASSVAPVAAQQAQQQQQIDQYISNAMSPPRTQDAGDNYSAPPPGKSVIGEGYNNPAFWGGLIGSIAGPLGSTIGKSLGAVAGTQRANQDLLSLGVPNQVSYRDALVGANVPFGLGDTLGIGVSPQRSYTDIVTSQLMPDQYAEYVGRAQGNAPQGVGDIPGVTSDIAPGMGPPGSPGSDSWGGDSSGSDWSGGGGGASP